MALDWSFTPDPNLKGSYYRRVEDIGRALGQFGTAQLPSNSPAQFLAYYFGAEKLARAVIGIMNDRPAKEAFLPRYKPGPAPLKEAAEKMGLGISRVSIDALFEPQPLAEDPTTAREIRNRLFHDFGPTQVGHIRKHAPHLVPLMVEFIRETEAVLAYLRGRAV